MSMFKKIILFNIGKQTKPATLLWEDQAVIDSVKTMVKNRATIINVHDDKGVGRVSFFVEKSTVPFQYSNVAIRFAGKDITINISDVLFGTIPDKLPDGYDKINLGLTRDLQNLTLLKYIVALQPKISYSINTNDTKLADATRKDFMNFARAEEAKENINERLAKQAQNDILEFAAKNVREKEK